MKQLTNDHFPRKMHAKQAVLMVQLDYTEKHLFQIGDREGIDIKTLTKKALRILHLDYSVTDFETEAPMGGKNYACIVFDEHVDHEEHKTFEDLVQDIDLTSCIWSSCDFHFTLTE